VLGVSGRRGGGQDEEERRSMGVTGAPAGAEAAWRVSSHSFHGPGAACVQVQMFYPRDGTGRQIREARPRTFPPQSASVARAILDPADSRIGMLRPTGNQRPFAGSFPPSSHRPSWLDGYPEAVANLGVELRLPGRDEDYQLTGVLLRTAGHLMPGVNTAQALRHRIADGLGRLMYPPAADPLTRRERKARDHLQGWALPRGVAEWRDVVDGLRTNGSGGFYDRVVLFQLTVTFGFRFKVIQKSRLPDDLGPINGHLFVLAKIPAEPSAGVTTDLWIPTRPVRPGAGIWMPGAGHGLAGAAEGRSIPQVYQPARAEPVAGNDHLQQQRRLAVVAAARDLAGRLRWRGATGPDPKAEWRSSETTKERHPNHMAIWLHRDHVPEPAEDAIMNCWDAIFFSAYRARLVDKEWLRQIYGYASTAAMNATRYHRRRDPTDDTYEYPSVKDRFGRVWNRPMAEYYGALMAGMHSGPLRRYTTDPVTGVGGPDIPAGHLVFFDWPEHIAMSAGTRDAQGRQVILSSWVYPHSVPDANPVWNKSIGFMQETTVEELVRAAGMKNPVIEFAAPSWAPPTAVQGMGGPGSVASGSVARSITDATGVGVGELLGPRPGLAMPAGESPSRRTAETGTPAAWVTDRTRSRADAIDGAAITVGELRARLSAAVAEADRRLAREAERFPWGPLPRGLQEVCLAQMRALAGELFPLGIGSGAPLDDAALPTDPATRRRLERPDDWTRITDWQALVDQVDDLGVNGAAFVVQGRPGAIGHAFALVRTAEGVHTADPHLGGAGVFPTSPAGLEAPFDVRALLVRGDGRVAHGPGDATVAGPPPAGGSPATRRVEGTTGEGGGTPGGSPLHRAPAPHIDHDRHGIAWVSAGASAHTRDGEPIPPEERACVSVTVITRAAGRFSDAW
jgi:hypothetical protein